MFNLTLHFPDFIKALVAVLFFPAIATAQVRIVYNIESQPLLYGIAKIKESLADAPVELIKDLSSGNESGDILVRVDESFPWLRREGYEISVVAGKLFIRATDPVGAMYGSLDVAEQIRGGLAWKAVAARRVNPHFSVRAIKFNLPWSSYRTGPAMEAHMEICRDLDFWRSFLDQMAENRFNILSLWNVHPFSFMVKPTNFPYANNFSEKEMHEWKNFWTGLFGMCRERGIEPFVVNWNIAVSPEFAKHYGVMERNDTSAVVKRYIREVVTQVINEYPDLAGIGITLADWMSNFRQHGSSLPEMTPKDREDWIQETVVAGIKHANRAVKFLHRSVLSADPAEMRSVIDEADLPDTTLVEIKFNWSHGHSSPALLLTHDQHSGEVENHYWDPLPRNYRIQWMIRNEDFFILRWGQSDFIREHISKNSKPYVNGYFVGSEGYIPAKDLAHPANDHRSWKYAYEKQWLFYQLWGRLLYDPATPDRVFASSFERRYNIRDGASMLRAWKKASNMALQLASFHAATWDYTLYSEGFLAPFPSNGGKHDTISSFISIDELIHHPVLDPRYLDIDQYVRTKLGKKDFPEEKITPLQLAMSLEADGRDVLSYTGSMKKVSGRLRCELDDLETWAHLSLYFADKVRAGTALHFFRLSGDIAEQKRAIDLLRRCLKHWQDVCDITKTHYREVPYIDHLGYGIAWRDAQTFSWTKYLVQVSRDIEIAEESVAEK